MLDRGRSIFIVTSRRICHSNDVYVYVLYIGRGGQSDTGVSKVRVQAVADTVPGLRARGVHVGRVLVVRHWAGLDQPAPSVGYVQNGTGFGSGRGRRSSAQGPGRGRATGGRHVHHTGHTGWSHQLDGVHDWRESRGHDQRDVAEIAACHVSAKP